MNPYLILVLAWLLPGLGHWLQKRRLRGAVIFVGIAALLALGLVMQGKLYDTRVMHPLLLLGFVGDLGSGLFFFAVRFSGLAGGQLTSPTFHYGTAYLAAAGLLNYLAALNAFDIAKGRKP